MDQVNKEENYQGVDKELFDAITKLTPDSLKYKDEKLDLEEKQYQPEDQDIRHTFDLKFQEINNEISKLIRGESVPTLSEEDFARYNLDMNANITGSIPDYWPSVVKNTDFFTINEKDEVILKHLENITLQLDNKLDFTVTFNFAKNEYFEASTLSKSYLYSDKTGELVNVKASKVEWSSPDKNPKKMKKTKKVKSKGKDAKISEVEEEVASFFDIFEQEGEDIDIEYTKSEADFIKDTLVPYSMEYFLNIVDEDDHNHEEEEEEEVKQKAKKEKKPAAAGAKDEKCKNQ